MNDNTEPSKIAVSPVFWGWYLHVKHCAANPAPLMGPAICFLPKSLYPCLHHDTMPIYRIRKETQSTYCNWPEIDLFRFVAYIAPNHV